MSDPGGEQPEAPDLARIRSVVKRYEAMEERISVVTLRFAIAALAFVAVVLGLYATKDSLTSGFWVSLRRVSMWVFPLYLLFTVAGVLVGLYTAWGGTRPAVVRRGLLACCLSLGSIAILLAGSSLLR